MLTLLHDDIYNQPIMFLLERLQQDKVECRYNALQYNMIFHRPLHWLTQSINQTSL